MPNNKESVKLKLNFGLLNICSLYYKCNDVFNLIKSYSFNVFAITETWLNSSVCNRELLFNDFKIHRLDRRDSNRGGVCLLERHSSASCIENTFITDNVELLHVSFDCLNSKSLQIIFLYSRHTKLFDFINDLDVFLSNVNYKYLPFLILGDFNCNLFTANKRDPLVRLLNSFTFRSCHSLSTRVTQSTNTCIDLVFANNLASSYANKFLSQPVAFSDHNLVSFCYKKFRNSHSPPVYIERFVYCNRDIDKFCNLLDYSSSSFFNSDLNVFISHVTYLHNLCFPTKFSAYHKMDNTKFFLSASFSHAVIQRDNFFKLYRETGIDGYCDKFKHWRRVATAIASKDKKCYFQSNLDRYSNKNPKKIWNFLRMFFKDSKDTFEGSYFLNGDELDGHLSISNGFNNYFCDIVTSSLTAFYGCLPSSTTFDFPIGVETANSFSFVAISSGAIFDQFMSFKPASVDKNFLTKHVFLFHPVFFSHFLASILNNCFSTCLFPDCLKTARIIPVHKKGALCDIQNYRPIAILPTINKVFERIIFSQITTYLSNNRLLHDSQFGFSKGNSTESAVLFLLSRIYKAINEKLLCSVVFLDLSKAFDTVCHSKLCKKLVTLFSFSGNATKLLFSYLSSRMQCVLFQNLLSSVRKVSFGVPQGSILGPLLFKMYLNDIFSTDLSPNSSIIMFADDIALVTFSSKPKNLCSHTNRSLQEIYKYCRDNQLILNNAKSNVMVFNNTTNINYAGLFHINDTPIALTSFFRYLGFIIDDKLSFRKQACYISSKLSSCNSVLSRSSSFINSRYLQLLFNSIGLSYVIYSKYVIFHLPSSTTNVIKRRLLHSGSIIHSCLLSHVPVLFDLNSILLYYIYCFIFKIIKLGFSPQLSSLLQFLPHSYLTRRNNDLYRSHVRSYTCQRNFSFSCPTLWNNLPTKIRDCKNLEAFKIMLQKHLSFSP